MRKLLFFFLILASTLNAQESANNYHHELRLNALNLVLGNPELDYEYLLNENSGAGIYASINVDNNKIFPYNFMAGPYYRLYVGSRYASGFFFEGTLSVIGEKVDKYDPNTGSYSPYDKIGFGPSVAIGGKFVIRKSVVFEFFGGIGRNFSADEFSADAFPRIGISIGKRF